MNWRPAPIPKPAPKPRPAPAPAPAPAAAPRPRASAASVDKDSFFGGMAYALSYDGRQHQIEEGLAGGASPSEMVRETTRGGKSAPGKTLASRRARNHRGDEARPRGPRSLAHLPSPAPHPPPKRGAGHPERERQHPRSHNYSNIRNAEAKNEC